MVPVVDVSFGETPDDEDVPLVAYKDGKKTVIGVAQFVGGDYTLTFNDTALAREIQNKIAESSLSFEISSQK